MKNWKRRFFVLTEISLGYYKTIEVGVYYYKYIEAEEWEGGPGRIWRGGGEGGREEKFMQNMSLIIACSDKQPGHLYSCSNYIG